MLVSSNNLSTMTSDLPVMINEQPIPRVYSYTCLGVALDEALHWDKHNEMICKNVRRGVGTMKHIKPYVPPHTLPSIYNALIVLFRLLLSSMGCLQ